MTRPRSPRQSALNALLGASFSLALTFSAIAPAHAQEDAAQTITEPTPLISVRPGPAVPPEEPRDLRDVQLPDMYFQPVGPFTMYMNVIATGPSEYGLFTAPGCVLDSIFKRGMK